MILVLFGALCAWSDSKPCNSRPNDSISPKRELQSLVFGPDSCYSPRRPWMGL